MISSYYNKYYNLSGLQLDTDSADFTPDDFSAVGKLVKLVHLNKDTEEYNAGYDYMAVLETCVPRSDSKKCYVSVPCVQEDLIPCSVH